MKKPLFKKLMLMVLWSYGQNSKVRKSEIQKMLFNEETTNSMKPGEGKKPNKNKGFQNSD